MTHSTKKNLALGIASALWAVHTINFMAHVDGFQLLAGLMIPPYGVISGALILLS